MKAGLCCSVRVGCNLRAQASGIHLLLPECSRICHRHAYQAARWSCACLQQHQEPPAFSELHVALVMHPSSLSGMASSHTPAPSVASESWLLTPSTHDSSYYTGANSWPTACLCSSKSGSCSHALLPSYAASAPAYSLRMLPLSASPLIHDTLPACL